MQDTKSLEPNIEPQIPAEGFQSPHEELVYLRQKLQEKERELAKSGHEQSGATTERAAQEVLDAYHELPSEEVLSAEAIMDEAQEREISLKLAPDLHDDQIGELYSIMLEQGVKNALNVVARIKNPHLMDDFHRFLVQFLAEIGQLPGTPEGTQLFQDLEMRLFQVTLPYDTESTKGYREFVTLMEQFYAGMQTIGQHGGRFALEVALAHDTDHVVFYAAVPKNQIAIFEKQVEGLYTEAILQEVTDDYNIFNPDGVAAAAYAAPQYSDLFTLTTYDQFDHDPMNVLLNVFSKLETAGEGAALQIIIKPVGDQYIQDFGKVLEGLRKGEDLDEALRRTHTGIKKFMGGVADSIFKGSSEGEEPKESDQDAIASVTEKTKSTIVETNVRIVTSAKNSSRAVEILRDMEAAFNQFTNTKGNAIEFEYIDPRQGQQFLEDFTFRRFAQKQLFRLNNKELATVFHFPAAGSNAPQLKQSDSTQAPPPVDIVTEGVVLGKNTYRGRETVIKMAPKDRVRHLYVIGQTGTGKSVLLTNLVYQDIQEGRGCCFIDPHGSDVQYILSTVPKERVDDVIYFDPAQVERPMAFNMLEYDPAHPEQKTFVVDEMLGIFNKLFDMKTAGGPMFEQYFRNATMLVIEDPETGGTLLDISRVLTDEKFRELKLSRCGNPVVVQFWREVAGKAGGEASLQNIVPYITSKFDVFLSNEIMRPIVAQQKSAFNFREVMDQQKILLVNLSKGRLGDINANLLGLIMVGKIQMAALSRVDALGKDLPPFYLYIDEFQNVTTNSISSILSEARKYGLSLNVAHQYISQLQEDIRNAVFGNAGSMAVFRISPEDAKALESKFAPVFNAQDIQRIPNWNAYMAMLMNGKPVRPFNIATYPPPKGNPAIIDSLQQLSFMKYGRPRKEVEDEIMAKYKKTE